MFPPTRSRASVTSVRVPGLFLPSVNAVLRPETPAPMTTASYAASARQAARTLSLDARADGA
jgi:hypothetical protein